MSLRAALFDVYGTLLEVTPVASEERVASEWTRLCREFGISSPTGGFREVRDFWERRIAQEHSKARELGVGQPEIFWPDVVDAVIGEVALLPEPARTGFQTRLAGLTRTVRLAPGAGDVLRVLAAQGVLLGIASNAQPYTLLELEAALATAGLSLGQFEPGLCFWSFEHGFSKPNPHVFRMLTARLRLRGIRPDETLMVGDREDNDVLPARASGWRTWWLRPAPGSDWSALQAWLERLVSHNDNGTQT